MNQAKQGEWSKQWTMFRDDERFLFNDWISPNTLEDFRDKEVLECGCGGGQHTRFIAHYAKSVTAVDLNTADIARERNADLSNVKFLESDIASMDLGKAFDVVFSIGVIHHTDDPDRTFENLKKHVKRGGKLIIWVYSEEGNFFVKNILEPVRKSLLCRLNKNALAWLAKGLTLLMYMPVYSLYLLPVKFLPYYEYFGNFRALSFERNCLNVFDKLNAPQVKLIKREKVCGWFNELEFKDPCITSYKGVSWRATGIKNG